LKQREFKTTGSAQEKREVRKMREVRNTDGRLMAKYDKVTGRLEMRVKDCVTVVIFPPGTEIEIVNSKKTV
jgi:hypothetical protein